MKKKERKKERKTKRKSTRKKFYFSGVLSFAGAVPNSALMSIVEEAFERDFHDFKIFGRANMWVDYDCFLIVFFSLD